MDDLLSVSQSGLNRTFFYDSLKRLVAANNPENATAQAPAALTCPNAGNLTWSTCYSYDQVGNLISKTDNRDATTNHSYDPLNRITAKSYPGYSTPSAYYCYDALFDTAHAKYENSTACSSPASVGNALGHLTKETNGNSTTLYNNFDALGRVLSHSQLTAGMTYGFIYGYNLQGDLISEQYPSGRTVATCYDFGERVSQVGGNCNSLGSSAYATGISVGTGIQYAPQGVPSAYQFGNGVQRSFAFNGRLQPISATDQFAGQSVLTMSWNWGASNNNGNLRGATDQAFTQAYQYDNLNRLMGVTDTSPICNGIIAINNNTCYSRNFGYDAAGNMYVSGYSVIPEQTAPQAPGLYNAYNQLTAGSYDQAGNQLAYGGNSVSYDAENRQTLVSGPGVYETYVYDAEGRRVEKLSSGTSPQTTVFVYDALGRMAAEYVNFAQAPPCITCYLSSDQLGTARMITDQSGLVVSRHDYLPFGGEINGVAGRTGSTWGPAADDINQKFTGKERDAESGLDYFGARYYASSMGRFMSPDWSAKIEPVPYSKLDDPQTLNLYAYARNNPLSNVDVDGHETEQEKQAKIAAAAKAQNGSTSYNINTTNVSNMQIFKPGSDKCNEFVADTVKSADGTRPVVDGTGKIPTAAQFADPNVKITGLSAPEPLANAKPGDIIAQDHGPGKNGNEEGHVGIVVGLPHDGQPGQTASANANVGGKVTINDWGFRSPTASPNNGERNGASSPAPVVRHPLGDPQ